MIKKLGRRPAVHTRRTMRSALVMAEALNELGPPPAASNDYLSAIKVPWGMYLNDQLGDCVCADTAHTLMLRTANCGTIVVPTDNDVLALYGIVGGYNPRDPSTDQGCDETAMCDYIETVGFLGHKSDATGNIEPTNLDHLRWCVQLFGTCRLGVNLPSSAEKQFDNGQPWDVVSGDTDEGGHDVPLVKYDGSFFYCVTWGGLQPITPAWMLKYCEEAHSGLFFDWIRQQGTSPSALSLNDLAAKMASIDE